MQGEPVLRRCSGVEVRSPTPTFPPQRLETFYKRPEKEDEDAESVERLDGESDC